MKELTESLYKSDKTASSKNRVHRTKTATKIPDEQFYHFGESYFDGGEGSLSYGKYVYDGRYKRPVKLLIERLGLNSNDKILEVGCAKGFILYEFFKLGFTNIQGIDVSEYAISSAPEEIKPFLSVCDLMDLEMFRRGVAFDFVYSKEVLPHLDQFEVGRFLTELPNLLNKNGIAYLEIQTAHTLEGLNQIAEFDPTHRTLLLPQEWRQLLKKHLGNDKPNIYYHLKCLF